MKKEKVNVKQKVEKKKQPKKIKRADKQSYKPMKNIFNWYDYKSLQHINDWWLLPEYKDIYDIITPDKELLLVAGVELEQGEVFLIHPRYPDYFISNKGRVFSNGCCNPQRKAMLRKQQDNTKGYKEIRLNSSGKEYVHKLVAEIYCYNLWKDTNQENTLEVHHIDGNKENNKATNLLLLPDTLHQLIHKGKYKEYLLIKGKSVKTFANPLELSAVAGISLDTILKAPTDQRRVCSHSKEVQADTWNIDGKTIGIRYTN